MDSRLKRLQGELSSAIENLSGEELSRHPTEKWSIAEILEHLYLTYTGTIKGLERTLAAGETRSTSVTWRQRGRRLIVLGLSYFPAGREAPKMTRPRGVPADQILAEIATKISEMDAFLARCEDKFGAGRELLDHPILGPLTGAQWRKFHLVHGRHHLKQIQALRQRA